MSYVPNSIDYGSFFYVLLFVYIKIRLIFILEYRRNHPLNVSSVLNTRGNVYPDAGQVYKNKKCIIRKGPLYVKEKPKEK